ncbi:MAG: DUF6572 domain-containing protein [Planctomycetota bacterium]
MGIFSRFFSKPTPPPSPPIQNPDAIDIIGRRVDGGVDMMLVASAYLDGSPSTQQLLKDKLDTYLAVLADPQFIHEFGPPTPTSAHIIIRCVVPPAQEIVALVEQLKPVVVKHGASLELHIKPVRTS